MDKLTRLSERLQLNKFKLQTLLDITKGINDNLSISQLVAIYRGIVEGELGLSKLVLYSSTEFGWRILLQYGDERDHLPRLDDTDFTPFKSICVLNEKDKQVLDGFDILIPVLHDKKPLAYLFIGDLDDGISISPIIKHMNFIQTLTNILVVSIENKRLLAESLRQERIRRELELAAEMQSMLVPSDFQKNDIIEVDALYYPHQEVGGDYYDQFKLKSGKEVTCIADVSGKGIAAAFLMANFQARLRAQIEIADTIEELIHQLNSSVVEATNGDRFITFFLSVYNPDTRELEYVNAGHNPPILIGPETSWLKKGCMGLGMLDEIPVIESDRLLIDPLSVLTCFTDGLVEVENSSGVEYGETRLEQQVIKHREAEIRSLNQAIRDDFDQFRGSNPPHDDFALLSVRFF
ncbi:MAG: PP2C family protein-serine/threonine phosphatase [Flavobacteriales bacterium]|nr:PP2C family protein-serine/threonine phosphatase [Flavobacteriales bacterium]